MTTREMMDSLSETLMCDERMLSVPERELLTDSFMLFKTRVFNTIETIETAELSRVLES
jgi:hypothetical protein